MTASHASAPDPTGPSPTSSGGAPRTLTYAIVEALVAGWLVALSRVLTGVTPDLPGLLDDATLVCLFTALQTALYVKLPGKRLRGAVGLLLTALLASLVFANEVFFSFFQTDLSWASLQLAGIAAAASSSIIDLLTPANVLGLLVVPIAAQAAALHRLAGARRQTSTTLAWSLFFLGLLLAGLGSALRDPVILFSQNNPILALVRDVSSRGVSALGFGNRNGDVDADVTSLLNRDAWRDYAPTGGAGRPLLQAPLPGTASGPTAKSPPNVVVILMESMRGYEMQGAYRELPVTPILNGLEPQSLTFPNFYANGMDTVDGEFALLCSALPVPNEAPVYIQNPELDIRCLPEILKQAGYETHWISAYKASYANKRHFLRRHGMQYIQDEDSLDPSAAKHPPVGWGMGDVDMFAQAVDMMDGFRTPFFAEIMTLSDHHPFDHDYDIDFPASFATVHGNGLYHHYLEGMYYTDHAIGEFLAAARKRPWFANTIFVILGDHGVHSFPTAPDGDSVGPMLETEIYFRGHLQIYAPALIEPRRIDAVGSQIDVAPTILDLLGIRTENSFLGVSLLADLPPENRFALMDMGLVANIRRGNQYCYSVGYTCFRRTFPRCAEGEAPGVAAHTCFELQEDLFSGPENSKTLRALDPLERARLLDQARRVMDLDRWLISEGRFR